MARASAIALWLLASGCLSPAVRSDLKDLENRIDRRSPSESERPPPTVARSQPALPVRETNVDGSKDDTPRPPRFLAAPPAAVADPLADSVDLKSLVDEALRRNPELAEMQSRARSALEDVRSAGSLDDPMFKVETEGVPLHRPLSFDRSQDNMFGLEQTFPFPGKLRARTESALASAQEQLEMSRGSTSEIIARVKKAYFAYFMLTRELEIHLQHVKLLEDFERITESRFQNGAALQQDVLKAQLELVMLHNDVLTLEQRLGSTKAEINTLLNRQVDAPLGKPRDITVTEGSVDIDALQDASLEARPELRALKHRVEAAKSAESFAEKDAWLPDFTVGVDYWQVSRADDAWGGFVSINLPWLTGKKAAEARKRHHEVSAQAFAAERGARQVLFEVRDAYLRVEAARTSYRLIQGELVPKANQNVEVTRSSYENDKTSFLDLLVAERSLRDVELSLYRALAGYESAHADLERASGANLDDKP